MLYLALMASWAFPHFFSFTVDWFHVTTQRIFSHKGRILRLGFYFVLPQEPRSNAFKQVCIWSIARMYVSSAYFNHSIQVSRECHSLSWTFYWRFFKIIPFSMSSFSSRHRFARCGVPAPSVTLEPAGERWAATGGCSAEACDRCREGGENTTQTW